MVQESSYVLCKVRKVLLKAKIGIYGAMGSPNFNSIENYNGGLKKKEIKKILLSNL